MKQTKRCGENQMIGDENQFSFTSTPKGEGVWMQKISFTTENCMVQKITLKKDCATCPTTSPFGILKEKPNETFLYHQDSVIVWIQQNRDLGKECKIKEKRKSTGTITKIDENTYKLTDAPGQLDYVYVEDTKYT